MRLKDIGPFLTAIAGGNADPRTELDYKSPFYAAGGGGVVGADHGCCREQSYQDAVSPQHPTRRRWWRWGRPGLVRMFARSGFGRPRRRTLRQLSQFLIERHGGAVPGDREALEALPGVGRKTANVVLNEIFGHATMAVDTHIFRLGNRTGIAPGTTPREVENGLLKRVPAHMLKPAHLWLILHGRYICKARTPECWRCGGVDYCVFKPKTLAPLANSGPNRVKKKTRRLTPTGQVNREASRSGRRWDRSPQSDLGGSDDVGSHQHCCIYATTKIF